MEEKTGERINLNRTTEAVETGADQIAVGCPFCRVMLSDGLTSLQADGKAREEVEVLDVAQMLLASVKRADAAAPQPVATKAEPERGRRDPDRGHRDRPPGRRRRRRRGEGAGPGGRGGRVPDQPAPAPAPKKPDPGAGS